MELTSLTMVEALEGLRQKKFSASELVKAHIDLATKHDDLNCFITKTFDQAIEQAKVADARYAKGEALPLDGIPMGMKDLFCTKGVQTTAASRILEGFIPQYESTVSQNLKDAGTISLGKMNLDEFAMGSSNLTSGYGPVKSPWKRKGSDKDLTPGGSSGGSASAVSGGLCMIATGTDTGGSIRQPASFVGIVGLKPTYGLCSRWGVVAFASSLDQAGPLTRTVRDNAMMLQAMASFDLKDSTSMNVKIPDYVAGMNGNLKGLKVGIAKEYVMPGMNAEIEKLWDQGKAWLKAAGAEIIEVSLPHTMYALPAYYVIAPAEASSNLARYDGVRYGIREEGVDLNDLYKKTRAKGFGTEVKRRILIGTYMLSAEAYEKSYRKAMKVRRLVTQDFTNAFQKVDVLLTPTAPSTAFALDEKITDPVTMYLNDVFTVPANLAGIPAISVPAGLASDGLPLGLQLIGPALSEATLYRAAEVLEKSSGFEARPILGGAK